MILELSKSFPSLEIYIPIGPAGLKTLSLGLKRLRKYSLYEGHGFSRAANAMLGTRL
jgi:hypothetical protein